MGSADLGRDPKVLDLASASSGYKGKNQVIANPRGYAWPLVYTRPRLAGAWLHRGVRYESPLIEDADRHRGDWRSRMLQRAQALRLLRAFHKPPTADQNACLHLRQVEPPQT